MPVASLVDDIAPGPLSSDPRDLTAMNGELFFSAWDPRHGRELWKSDGTAGGTTLASDIVPGGDGPVGEVRADGATRVSVPEAIGPSGVAIP
jgi:ELWxxDGT repeat protein